MTRSSIDLGDRLAETGFLPTLEQIGHAVATQGISALLVGATARDLVLHYGYGATIRRATRDIDFGVQVTSWQAFQQLREQLMATGWNTTPALPHRLISPDRVQVDLVPFGDAVTDHAGQIAWPPSGEIVMTVLGFQEALDHALQVRVNGQPPIDVLVASPAGSTLLKLVAWSEREGSFRRKDAIDLAYLMSQYEIVPDVLGRLYGDEADILARYGYDPKIAGAWLLGHDIAQLAQAETGKYLSRLLTDGMVGRSMDQLILDMCAGQEGAYEIQEILLRAFIAGYMSAYDYRSTP